VGSYFENANARRANNNSNNNNNSNSNHVAFGFVPEVPSISSSREEGTALELESAKQFVETFSKHVDVRAIVEAAVEASKRAAMEAAAMDASSGTASSSNNNNNNNKRVASGRRTVQPITRVLSEHATATTTTTATTTKTKRPRINGGRRIGLTRKQVEEAAERAGAAGG